MKMKHLSGALIVLLSACYVPGCTEHKEVKNTNRELVPDPEGQRHDSFVLNQPDSSKNTATIKSTNTYYPFELLDSKGTYQIMAQIESPQLYPKYYSLFEKYDYEGNGYCWEGHIKQIIEKLDKELLKHIVFDPEGGSFYATADTKANQLRFVELLSPIFSDLGKLETWIKKADRTKIDD